MDEKELNYVNAVDGDISSAPAEKQKKARPHVSAPNLLVGLLVVALACFGVYRLVQIGVDYFRDRRNDLAVIKAGEYYAYLIPAAAVDIEPFEDLSAAKMSELVEMTVWGVLNSGLDSTQYRYEGDTLLLPEAQVAAAFVHYFGAERAVEHMTVSGYGYEFTYDAAAHVYKIPLTTITPVYAPVITETEQLGDSTVLTVGYLNTGLYAQNALTGELTAPEPDKFVKITVRSASTGDYISAVRAVGLPETAATAAPAETEAPSETQAPEETSAENEDEGESEDEDESGSAQEPSAEGGE